MCRISRILIQAVFNFRRVCSRRSRFFDDRLIYLIIYGIYTYASLNNTLPTCVIKVIAFDCQIILSLYSRKCTGSVLWNILISWSRFLNDNGLKFQALLWTNSTNVFGMAGIISQLIRTRDCLIRICDGSDDNQSLSIIRSNQRRIRDSWAFTSYDELPEVGPAVP